MKTKSILLTALALTLPLAGARAAVVTFQPVEDAYLSSSGSEADQTWNSTELAQFGYYGAFKRPLLKFDLSSIPDGATVTSAQLVLQQIGIYGGDGYFTTLSRMANDNWFETNVTWNSYNQAGAVVIATLPFESGGTKTWQINLATWAYAEDLADDAVTVMVRWDVDIYGGTEGDGVYKSRKYSSKEGTVAPTLQIEYTAPPPPFTHTTSTVPVGDGDSGPDCVAFADVNGDGRLDLISANYGFRWGLPGDPGGWNNTLTVLTNNGSGGFASNASLTIGRGPSAVVAADVNGDGKPDLISANETDNTLTVLTNAGNGGFAVHATLPVGSRPRGLVATDLNGDLAPDLVCVNAGGNSLTVLTNQGGGFGFHATLPVGNEPLFVAAADVNGDGKPDLISANKDDDSLTVLTNHGGGFGFSATLPVGHLPDAVSAADFNGDAKVDLVSVNWGAATMTVLTNNGSGGFGFNATLPVGNYPSTVAAADFNGDGAADLICASTEANSLRVLTNNGSGVFGYDKTGAVGRIPNVFAADLNSDGKLDLACPNFRDGTVTVLLNTTAFTPANSRPPLTIERQGNGVRVAWSAATPGWSLQQKPDLNAANWLPSGHEGFTVTDDGSYKSLTLPASHANRFFRLLHP